MNSITEENIDKIIKFQRKMPNLLVVDWWLGNFCNYKCEYCFPYSNKGDKRVPPFDVFEHNFNYFLQKIKDNNLIPYFVFAGGEPTIYNQIINLLKITKENNFGSLIVTNGSRTLKWWSKNVDLFDGINISYHTQYKNEKHILEVAKILKNKRLTVTIMVPNNHLFEISKNAHNFFLENNILRYANLAVKPLQDKNKKYEKLYDYNNEQLEFIKKNANFNCLNKKPNIIKETTFGYDYNGNQYFSHTNVLLRLNPNFKGWKCSVGREFISINYNGDIVTNCGEKIFDRPFNLYKDDLEEKKFDFIKKDIICKKGNCMCLGLYSVSKSK